jgi:HNH endonuclease
VKPLVKGTKPPVLVRHEDLWKTMYVAAVKAGDPRLHERWRHREIKGALREETQVKCAYCEAFLADVSYPHVEHIIPKSVRPDLAHQWENLTAACGPCNGYKDNFYDLSAGLLDPYRDHLETHLEFHGDYIDWVLGSARGEITVAKLRLNRFDLVQSRLMRIGAVRSMLERWHEATGVRKEVLAEGIRLDCSLGEFTAAVRAFLSSKQFPLK